MFETSVVRERAVERRRYSLFTASLAIHTLVVAGIVAASLGSIALPRHAPNAMAIFSAAPPITIPPPLGSRTATPPHRAATPTSQPANPRVVTAPPADAAPTQIPSETLPVPGGGGTAMPGSGTTDQPYGDPNGAPDGIDLGQAARADSTPLPDVTFAPGGEVRAARVLSRVEPEFPRAALAARMSGVVVLRCVIDTNGGIRDTEVVSSTAGIFEQAALRALQQWRFAPGSYRGRAVDTWFELTIRFTPR